MKRQATRLAAFVPALLFVLTAPIRAATPSGGTLTPDATTLNYTFPFAPVANVSGQTQDIYTCNTGATDPCDVYTLTVTIPADYMAAHPHAYMHIQAATTSSTSDIDLQLADENGKNLASHRDNPPDQPFIDYPVAAGTTTYQVQVIPGSPHEGGTASITLVEGAPPPPPDADGDGVSDADDQCPGTPAGTSVDVHGCPLPAGDPASCAAPGLTVLTDATGDNSPAVAGTDLKSVAVYQPAQDPATGNRIEDQLIAFVINVDAGAQPNPSYSWFTSFNAPGGLLGVRMTGDTAGNPVFQLYIPGEDNSSPPVRDGRFVTAPQPAEASSSFDAASGVITIMVKATDLGFTAPGQELSGFNAGVAYTSDAGGVGVGVSGLADAIPDDLSRDPEVKYVLTDNTVCGRPQLQPIGSPSPATGTPPRFFNFLSPAGLADSAGEPSIGYNQATNNMMFIAATEVDRITPAEHSDLRDAAGNPLPESCAPEWTDKSYVGAANTLDPILETYQPVGRTFQSSLSGANSIFAYSDDDGDTWTPGQAGPPNGGVDHQTVGIGPWPAGAKPPTATADYAIYYCSQSVAAAFCARSDNGGTSFGPGIAFRNSATDCDNTLGGLHGHVQVGPDGAVWVPFGNCGAKSAVAVSTDAGVTWKVKKILTSQAGGDPGLGIAKDGTAYFCYSAGDSGKVYATVSKDHGDTWTSSYELGADIGIKHTVFTTMVAGDGDRAACGFLGTSEDGNPGALDFEGVWYPYVAMTYDGGKSWHTINVSPGDPAQGWGGICTSGTTCGSNRNLLDFTDIQLTEQGRVVFAYADGCKGACVQNPHQNTFSDDGAIARQSGGRTLLSAFDDASGTQFNSGAAIKPAAACARADLSTRTKFETRVAWTAPDDGGTPITNYQVYRADAATGPFAFIADAGAKTYVIDPTADPTVAHYYYRVVAENGQGAGPISNVIDLPITVPVEETSCSLPGITVASEANAGDCAGTGGGCTTQTDIQGIYAAELPGQPDDIVLTVKVGDLNPAPAPGQYWYVLTKKKTGENLYLAMDTSGGTPRYTYGTYDVGTLTTFTEQGTIDPSSSYETNGSIHLVAPRSLFGDLQPGDVISSMEARTRAGDASLPSRDVVGPGDYTVRGTNVCLANTAPVAVLDALPVAGSAPLTVTFDASKSYDNDTAVPDTIKTYVINFGDGTGASAEGSEAPVWQHTYSSVGAYAATLRVTDSRGMQSANAAQKVIEVVPIGQVPGAEAAGNNRLGGALAPASLGVLGLLALVRRRRGALLRAR